MVLGKLRRPLPIPGIILLPLTSILKRIDPKKNWFGTRTRIIYLDNQKGQWIRLEYFSFRGAIKAILQSFVDLFRRIMHTDLQHVWSNYFPNKKNK